MGAASVSSSASFPIQRKALRTYCAPARAADQFALHNVQ